MKTIVLSNLKQVFETIMTLCNIVKLRVLSHNKKIVVYSDLFNDEKVIILNKEYSEVIYHDYSNNIHVCYEINNSEKLFIEYYNRYENSNNIISRLNEVIEHLEKDSYDLNNEIETITNEYNQEVDYLNNRIETLKNRNIELNKENLEYSKKIDFFIDENNDYKNALERANKELTISENKRRFIEGEYQELMRNYENLFDESETNKELLNELAEITLYNEEEIESLQNKISDLGNSNEKMSNKLAYYETEYPNIIAEKVQQYEKRCYDTCRRRSDRNGYRAPHGIRKEDHSW